MAFVLTLDSSGDVFSAAAGDGANNDRTVHAEPNTPHAACALPTINALLADCGKTLQQCDAFAFSAGPGKFSALRLVCALARTFAYANNKPLIAVPSFAALALANYADAPLTVKCALPANRQYVYFGVCTNDSTGWRVSSASLRDINGGVPHARLPDACGAGFALHPQLLGNARHNTTAPYSNASAAHTLAHRMLTDNALSDPLTCEPFYLRRKIAKTIRERQHENNNAT